LRIAFTPRFTSRSATGCAASAGVTSTAMSIACFPSSFSSVPMSSTVSPFHWRPILEGSLSKIAMMSKPRCLKPRYCTSALPIFPAPIIPTRYRRLSPRISRS
jgi:hypothetical protein